MGMIRIELLGSFEDQPRLYPMYEREASAEDCGHAAAVADIIRWLSQDILPAAIQHDHLLQQQGHYPTNRFGLSPSPEPENHEAPKEEPENHEAPKEET